MKWDKLLSWGFLLFFLVFLGLSIFAISTPLWIPEKITPRIDNFDGSINQLGDAIGGITSPFITLIMALLAFLAFWMQFQTLRDQRKELSRQHFEDRLSLMLSQQRENANSLKAGTVVGRSAIEELAGEFYYVLTLVTSIFKEKMAEEIKSDSNLDEPKRAKLTLYYEEIKNDGQKAMAFLMKAAYGVFFQGKNYTPNATEKEECLWLTRLIESKLDYSTYKLNTNAHYTDLLFDGAKDFPAETEVPYAPFQGHNAEMGCYYRHLYQIVRFIACYSDEEMTEEEKYGYTKLVRSHLSDYEQFMLYYNSLSNFGNTWDKPLYENDKYKPRNMGLIARFRLVKNLPSNICWRGLCPIDRYKREIDEWKKLNCDFFETSQFLTIDLLA